MARDINELARRLNSHLQATAKKTQSIAPTVNKHKRDEQEDRSKRYADLMAETVQSPARNVGYNTAPTNDYDQRYVDKMSTRTVNPNRTGYNSAAPGDGRSTETLMERLAALQGADVDVADLRRRTYRAHTGINGAEWHGEMPIVHDVRRTLQPGDEGYAGSIQELSDRSQTLDTMRVYDKAINDLNPRKEGDELTKGDRSAAIASINQKIWAAEAEGADPAYIDALYASRDRLISGEEIRYVEMYDEDDPLQNLPSNELQSRAIGEEWAGMEHEIEARRDTIHSGYLDAKQAGRWREMRDEAQAAGYEFTEDQYAAFLDEALAYQNLTGDYSGDVRDRYNYDEAYLYNYVLDTYGQDTADEYKKYIQPVVSERIDQENIEAMDLENKSFLYNAFGSTLFGLGKIANTIDIGIQRLDQIFNDSEYRIDYQTTGGAGMLSNAMRDANVARLEVFGDVNEWLGVDIPILRGFGLDDLYSIGQDTLNSTVNSLLFGRNYAGTVMGMQKFSDEYADAITRGGTDSQAFNYALGSAVAEGIGESIDIASYVGTMTRLGRVPGVKGKIAWGILQTIEGGVQEGATTMMEQTVDKWFMGNNTAFNVRVRELVSQGFDEETARDIAQDEAETEILQSALSGALGMAGPTVIGAPVSTYMNNYTTGATIRDLGNADLTAHFMSLATGKDVQTPKGNMALGRMYNQLINKGDKYADRMQRDEMAQAIRDYYNAQAGIVEDVQSQEAESTETEAKAEQKPAADQKWTEPKHVTQEQVDRITSKIEPPKARADKAQLDAIRDALVRVGRGKRLSGTQRRMIDSDPSARATRDAIKSGDIDVDVTGSTMARVAARTAPVLTQYGIGNNRYTTDDAKFTATIKTSGTTEAAKERAESRKGNMNIDATAENTTVGDETVTVQGIGKVIENEGEATVKVVDSKGNTKEVAMNEITFNDVHTADVYAYAQDMATPELAQAFIDTVDSTNEPIEYVQNGMQHAYDMALNGYTNIDTVRTSPMTTGLTKQQLQTAFDMGVKDRAAQIAARTERARKRQQASANKRWQSGRIIMGEVVMDGLSEEQKRDLDIVDVIAKVFGINIELFESKADKGGNYQGERGSYDPKTNTIRLDVRAGVNKVGDSFAGTTMLKTVAHELTHSLQRNSPEKYEAYKNAVLDVLEKNGQNIEEMIDSRMAEDTSLSREAAIDEIVADASETMLRDSDLMDRLQELHPEEAKTFIQKVLDLLKRIKDAIREAFEGVELSKEAQAIMSDIDRLAAQWSDLAVEAAEVSGREASSAYNDTVGIFDEPAQPAEAHIDQRNWKDVGDRSVNAFLNDYKYARIFMGNAAEVMLVDLGMSEPGNRMQTHDKIAHMLYRGMTWDDIGTSLTSIADAAKYGDVDTDIPNTAAIKRTELMLDEMLTNGYTALDGTKFAANAGYIEYKNALPGAIANAIPEAAEGSVEFDSVRFSTRRADNISDREILANVLEDAVQNEDERELIEEYRSKLGDLAENQKQLDAARAIIRELAFKPRSEYAEGDLQRLETAREDAKRLANKLARADKRLLKMQAMTPVKNVLARARQQAEVKMRLRKDEQLRDYRSRREATQLRKTVNRKASNLDKLLRNPTDKRHLPEDLRKPVLDLMEAFTSMDNAFGGSKDALAKLAACRRAYESMKQEAENKNGTSDYAAGKYDEDISIRMKMLEDVIEKNREGGIYELTADDLRKISAIMDHFDFLAREGNNEYINGKRVETGRVLSNIFDQMYDESTGRPKYGAGRSIIQKMKLVGDTANGLHISNMTPVYFSRMMGGQLGELMDSIINADATFGLNYHRAQARLAEISDEFSYDSWAHNNKELLTITAENGAKLKLTREQALCIWATDKRERGSDIPTSHLALGGVIFDEKAAKSNFNGEVTETTGSPLSRETLTQINDWLTDEQKQYADAMVAFVSNDMARLGNETSMELHGYKKFREGGYYFPFRTPSDFIRKEAGKSIDVAMYKNEGFTKPLQPGASTPVLITDFSDAIANHVERMCKYNALAVPQDTLQRILNYKAEKNVSVESLIRGYYGSGDVVDYMRRFLSDIHDKGRGKPEAFETLGGKLASMNRRGSVLGSASVAIQQPSALPRAMAMINLRHFRKPAGSLKAFEEAKKYSGVCVLKDMGGFDAGTSVSSTDWLLGRSDQWIRKHGTKKDAAAQLLNKAVSIAPEIADKLTWGELWNTVKREQAYETGLDINSEELKQIAGKRMDEVCRRTQVYDSVMVKSQVMRNEGRLKQYTSFMAEPTVTYNMVADALREGLSGHPKAMLGTMAAVVVGIIYNNALKSIVLAGRDDDDEKAPWGERWFRNFMEGNINDVVILNYVPIARDVWSMLMGYDVERPDASVINKGLALIVAIADDNKSVDDKLYSASQVLGTLTPVPIGNIWRDLRAVKNTFFKSATSDNEWRDNWTKYAMRDAVTSNTPLYRYLGPSDAERLYNAALEGDDAAVAEQRQYMIDYKGKDDKQINTSLRTEVKNGYLDGDIDEERAIGILTDYAGMEADDAYMKVQEWNYEWSGNGDWKKTAKVTDAIDAGDDKALAAAVEELVEYGGYDSPKDAAQTIASGITSTYKPLYIEASPAEQRAMKETLLDAYETVYETAGVEFDRDARSKNIDKWLD